MLKLREIMMNSRYTRINDLGHLPKGESTLAVRH